MLCFRNPCDTIAVSQGFFCSETKVSLDFCLRIKTGAFREAFIKPEPPAWELNAKVIDFIFFSSKKSKQGKARDFETPADKMFRITKKMMIYGRAYFKGDVIGEITDIGFSNVDQVIDRLVEQLPKDIPIGCMVQFRLMNCDSKKEVVYERSKGKGFM